MEDSTIWAYDINDDAISWLLNVQASPEMSAFDFRQTLLVDALTWGNGYAEIERDGYGRAMWLWHIPKDRVCVERDDSGNLYYEVKNSPGRDPTILPPENVFHLRGLGPDGIVGWSPVEVHRNSLKLAMDQEAFGESFFEKGIMPSGILTMPGNVPLDTKRQAKESFQRAYGGSRQAGNVIVISNGMEFNSMTLPNADAQYLESRRFSVEEVARIYGVPPHKIGNMDRATYSNIESQAIEAVQDCLLPWCRRLESEADIKLFGRINRGKRFTRVNLGALLRGDSQTQTTTVVQKVNNGIMTVNEGREFLELNPIDGGDTSLVQGAMIPLAVALEAKQPAQQAKPDGSKDNTAKAPVPDPEKPAKNVAAAFKPILAECYGRLLRVEMDKAKRAANKGQLDQHTKDFYTMDNLDHVVGVLRPVFSAFLLASNSQLDPDEVSIAAAIRHNERSIKSLLANGAAVDWSKRAEEQAAFDLGAVP